jgi:hypothetical protein
MDRISNPEYEIVLDIKVVIDEDWSGSISPYRIIRDGRAHSPMTFSEVKRELELIAGDMEYTIAQKIRSRRR